LAGNMTSTISACIPPQPCPSNVNLTECLKPNSLPVANAGEDQEVNEGSLVTLDSSKSYDKDGNVTYTWIQTGGDALVTISDADTAKASFYAPNVTSNLTLEFELTVFNAQGYGASDNVDVIVKNVFDAPPIPINGSITLDPIPRTLEEGMVYVFKGQLILNDIYSHEGKYVQIIDASSKSEDILSYGNIDKNGIFIAEWTANSKNADYHLYALYEDEGGSLKSSTYTVSVKPTQPRLENLSYLLKEPFIPIDFNNYRTSPLNVYIVATDEPSERFVPIVKSAVERWSQQLKQRSGNHQAWNFKYFTSGNFPDDSQTKLYPINILVNLKHDFNMDDCQKASGRAHTYWHQRLFKSTITTYVYTGCGSNNRLDADVFRTASHEFGHALGLGHTWYEGDKVAKTADMMCSFDYRFNILGILRFGQVDTCIGNPDKYNDKGQPSEFNIRAVIYAYGNDGFKPPNRVLIPFVNDFYKCQPLPCEPSHNVKPSTPVVKTTNPTNPTGPSTKIKQDVHKKTITTATSTSSKSYTTKYHFVSKMGFPGSGKAQMLEPTDLSIDLAHNIMYVADKNNNRIQKFDMNGRYIASWGSLGSGSGQFNNPADLAGDYSANVMFVADLGNNRIQKFDTNGSFLDMWGSFGKGSGQFDHVGDIDLDTKSKFVYTTDIGNHRVQKFDYDGKFISSWGSLGTGEGQFNRPAGIAYDSSGIVFVVDTKNNRIQKFDKEGNFLGMWGQLGKGTGQFDNPVSLNIDPTSNYLYVSDSGNKRIEIFDQKGNYINEWGIDGTSDGEFERPVSIAFGNSGQVYVVDKDRSDIQVFGTSFTNPASTSLKSSKKITTNSSPPEISKNKISTLDIYVKNANSEAGRVQIAAFGMSADQKNTKFDVKTFVDIGALGKDQVKVAAFKFNVGKDVPLGGYINACFDATAKPKNLQGGCNYIRLDSEQDIYTITLDMKGFRQ
jgi:6-phosphogluconolactonase (cycloisomerase 2 family)